MNDSLVSNLINDQRKRWLAGERPSLEDYFREYRDSLNRQEFIDLIYHEFLLREELGILTTVEEYLTQFPEYQEELDQQFELHFALESDSQLISLHSTRNISLKGSSYSNIQRKLQIPSSPTSLYNGRFVNLKQIGRGAMGEVYQAFDTVWQQTIAIKTLPRSRADYLATLKNEFRILSRLEHPYLVRLYELIVSPEFSFFTMDLIEGQDFVRACHNPLNSSYRTDFIRKVILQLAEALSFLHELGIVHSDLKPYNVLIDKNDNVVLLDFGLASLWREIAPAGAIWGTPVFISPEQIQGLAPTPASDCYSVGALLYMALTGAAPFRGSLSEILLAKQIEQKIITPNESSEIPLDLRSLCEDLLMRDPQKRPTAVEMIERLDRNAESPAIQARDAWLLPRSIEFVGRHTELQFLQNSLDRASERDPVRLLVSGRSGLGKTALIDEFVRRLQPYDDLLVLRSRCYPRESLAFKAFDGIVDDLLSYWQSQTSEDALQLIPRHIETLARMFPGLSAAPGFSSGMNSTNGELERPDATPEDVWQEATFALSEALRKITVDKRLVVIIDDLQWADTDSLVMLAELLSSEHFSPHLFIAVCRDRQNLVTDNLEAFSDQRFDQIWSQQLILTPLTPIEVTEFIQRTGGPGRNQLEVEVIQRITGGDPLLLLELCSLPIQELSRIGEAGDEHDLTARLLKRRMQRLPKSAWQILEIVSLAGYPIEPQSVCQLARVNNAPQRWLRLLRQERFLAEPLLTDSEPTRPFHDRVAEVAKDLISEDHARHLHLSLADLNASLDPPNHVRIVHHFREAGNLRRAWKHALVAAEQLITTLAFEQAAELYQFALGLELASEEERRQIQTALAEVLSHSGRNAEAARHYQELSLIADGTERERFQWYLTQESMQSGRPQTTLEGIDRILKKHGFVLPRSGWGRLLYGIILSIYVSGMKWIWKRSHLARAKTPEEVLNALFWGIPTSIIYDGRQTVFFASLHAYHSLRSKNSQQIALTELARSFPVAHQSTGQALTIIDSVGCQADNEPLHNILSMHARTWAYLCDENWSAARSVAEEGIEQFSAEKTHYWYILALTAAYQMKALFNLGELQRLRQLNLDLLRDAELRNDYLASHYARMAWGMICWLTQDNPEHARVQLDRSLKEFPLHPYSTDWHPFEVGHMHLLLYEGHPERCWQSVQKAWKRVGIVSLLSVRSFRSQLLLFRANSALLMIQSQHPQAPSFRKVIQDRNRLRKLNTKWSTTCAEMVSAQIAILRGDNKEAGMRLKKAAVDFEFQQGRLLDNCCRWRLHEHLNDGHPPPADHCVSRYFSTEGVVNPQRFVSMLFPVRPHGSSFPKTYESTPK